MSESVGGGGFRWVKVSHEKRPIPWWEIRETRRNNKKKPIPIVTNNRDEVPNRRSPRYRYLK